MCTMAAMLGVCNSRRGDRNRQQQLCFRCHPLVTGAGGLCKFPLKKWVSIQSLFGKRRRTQD